jgi:hypothetical protein
MFVCLFCEISRFFCSKIWCSCEYMHTIIHVILFFLWVLLVFYEAYKKSKVFYTKRQILFWPTTVAGYFLYILFCSKQFLGHDFWVRGKVLLFLCYILVIPQFLQLVGRKVINIIVLGSYIGIWAWGITCACVNRYTETLVWNPNLIACLLNFLTIFIILNDKVVSTVWGKITIYCFNIFCLLMLDTRFSFLLLLLVIPWCFCKYGIKNFFLFVTMLSILLLITLYSSCKKNTFYNSKISRILVLPKVTFQQYIYSYFIRPKILVRENNQYKLVKEHNKQYESHNFYIEMWRHFNTFDFLLMLYCLLHLVYPFTYFSIMHSLLLASYCMTITTPLYFFIAALDLMSKKKLRL